MKRTPQSARPSRPDNRPAYLSNIFIGLLLRLFRENRSLTQERVAELAGCHASYLSIIENGKAQLSIRTFVELCQALQLAPADLFVLASVLEDCYLHSDLIRSGEGIPEDPLTAQRWLQTYIREGHLGALDKKN
ncbi:MAG: XRE family transcriptional regulator [Clostridia bacterium]|nr:XRE family transcriptional regulator [Clostridia bacterium]NCC75031.1 XRE family transcriptional regulator [Clostridia bacterium]